MTSPAMPTQFLTMPANADDAASSLSAFVLRETMDQRGLFMSREISRAFEGGRQWYRFDLNTGNVFAQPRVAGGVIVNETRHAINLAAATAMAEPFAPEAVERAHGPKATRAAQTATAILDDVWRANGGWSWARRVMRNCMVMGSSVFRVAVVDGIPTPMVMDETQLRIALSLGARPLERPSQTSDGRYVVRFPYKGIQWDFVHPNNVVIPSGTKQFRDARAFAVVDYLTIPDLMQFVKSLQDVNQDTLTNVFPTAINNINAPSNSASGMMTSGLFDGYDNSPYGTRRSAMAGLVPVWSRWNRGDDGLWYMFVCIGLNGERYLGRSGPHANHNLVFIHYEPQLEATWSSSAITKTVIQHQRGINDLATYKIRALLRALKGMVVAPAKTKLKGITRGADYPMLELPTAESAASFKIIDMHMNGQGEIALRELDLQREQLRQEMGVTAIRSGDIPGRTSNATFRDAMKIDASLARPAVDALIEGMVDLWDRTLQVAAAADVYDFPRLVGIIGGDQTPSIAEYTSDDLYVSLVQTRARTTGSPLSAEDRFAQGIDMMKAGLFAPTSEGEQMRKMFASYQRDGRVAIEGQSRGEALARAAALQQIQRVRETGLRVVPSITPGPNGEMQFEQVLVDGTGRPIFNGLQPRMPEWYLEAQLDEYMSVASGIDESDQMREAAARMFAHNESLIAAQAQQREMAQVAREGRESVAKHLGQMISGVTAAKAREGQAGQQGYINEQTAG